MPRGLSVALLPAKRVYHATMDALVKLREDRIDAKEVCEADWVRQWRAEHSIKRIYASEEHIISKMPEFMKMWREHRKDDESVLMALAGLAEAAMDHDKNFTVEITADDFRIIREFYPKRQDKTAEIIANIRSKQ